VRVDLPPDLPRVEGEARALNQVFLNLLKNAAESLAVVEIRDDGPGIAPEVLERVFEPFSTTKGTERGSGLGLSICRRIVSQHEGSIELESEPGRGTIARVRLPKRRAAAGEGDAHAP
jgi:signal transduction histidine kinase